MTAQPQIPMCGPIITDGRMEFEVKGIIAHGAFGRVVEAVIVRSLVWEHLVRGRRVAIKVYSKRNMAEYRRDSLNTEFGIGRWISDTVTLALTRLWSVFEDENNVYLVMVSLKLRASLQRNVADIVTCRITTPGHCPASSSRDPIVLH
jgi:hypothetical protein